MTFLSWNHACSVGVRAMDDQHAILIDTLNELRLAILRGCPRERITDILGRLVDYTQKQFASEERLLERYGYPELERHRGEHARLLGQVRQLAERAGSREAVRLGPLLDFLGLWYGEHTAHTDRCYGPWLNALGVF